MKRRAVPAQVLRRKESKTFKSRQASGSAGFCRQACSILFFFCAVSWRWWTIKKREAQLSRVWEEEAYEWC